MSPQAGFDTSVRRAGGGSSPAWRGLRKWLMKLSCGISDVRLHSKFRMNAHRIVVVAAVIERNGQYLIGQRRSDDTHPGKWEFPGGKVEKGETPEAALQRELEEELLIQAKIGPEIVRYDYRYPRKPGILLIFHRVSEFIGEPSNGVFEQIKWEMPERLPDYDFLDGDIDFVRRLARREL
jgi:8-oxo-dGTP diphosphatase